jgi:hypothetical protein
MKGELNGIRVLREPIAPKMSRMERSKARLGWFDHLEPGATSRRAITALRNQSRFLYEI